uniref:Catalase n=1 Tax=Steinernema glaseri TaxID=37863 RepID=A0A1I8AT26_9BILA
MDRARGAEPEMVRNLVPSLTGIDLETTIDGRSSRTHIGAEQSNTDDLLLRNPTFDPFALYDSISDLYADSSLTHQMYNMVHVH